MERERNYVLKNIQLKIFEQEYNDQLLKADSRAREKNAGGVFINFILSAERYYSAIAPGLTSQRHSALISSDSEYFQVCFSAVHYLKISEQR